MELLHIRMLGEFSLSSAENRISDTGSRSKKVWQLLAYLICHRSRIVSAKELIGALWGEDPASSNPENTLKITFHRARSLLNQLWPTAGHQLIRHRENGYIWDQETPFRLDTEEFDRLCHTKSDDEDALLDAYLSALELYRGDFLEKLSSELWVIPVTTHYHNLYIQTVINAVPLLDARGRQGEAAVILRKAIAVEPYHEPLYQLLIQQLAAQGDLKAAREVYEELSQRLMQDFGIKPSDQTRSVFRAAMRTITDGTMTMETVLEDVQEKDAVPGALQCDYDSFKLLCHLEARSMLRSGKSTHIALISVAGPLDRALSKRSMHTAMAHMGEQIRLNLRRGDVFSQCSLSQYIIMLPEANYENSCMVCRRFVAAFTWKHPHSPVRLHFLVQPLSSHISVP